MAKTDNLQDYLTDLANAIREKKGTTGLINPQDFASEIASIETGGDGGVNEWQYYDVRNNTLEEYQWVMLMTMYPTLVAMTEDNNDATALIGSAGVLAMYGSAEAKERLKYIAIDMDVKQYGSSLGNQLISFKEYEAQTGQHISDVFAIFGITPITKEQFYTLE